MSEKHCEKCCKCVECKSGKRGKRGSTGRTGPTGPTGPSGRGILDLRVVQYNAQTDDPFQVITNSGPGDFDNQLGVAHATDILQTILFLYHNGIWRSV